MNLFDSIKKEAKGYFHNARGSHDWDHTERVYVLCMRIGKKEKANIQILKLAVLLHDIARDEEFKSKGRVCHAEKSAILARKILEKYKIDEDKIDKITECIRCHRFKTDDAPKSIEAKVLFDADKLDSIGAVGIGRTFLFAGEVGARLHNKEVDIEKTDPYTLEDTAYREFTLVLKKIKNRMMTREGKIIAKERHNYMVDFFKKLDKEVEGKE